MENGPEYDLGFITGFVFGVAYMLIFTGLMFWVL